MTNAVGVFPEDSLFTLIDYVQLLVKTVPGKNVFKVAISRNQIYFCDIYF